MTGTPRSRPMGQLPHLREDYRHADDPAGACVPGASPCGVCAGCRRRAAAYLAVAADRAHERRHRRGGLAKRRDDLAAVLLVLGIAEDPDTADTADTANGQPDPERLRLVPDPERAGRLRRREMMAWVGRNQVPPQRSGS